MSRSGLLKALLLPALSLSALAENWITVWYATGTYVVYQDPPMVVITSAGTFKVEATGDYESGLGDIRSITVAEGVSGTVNLYVLSSEPYRFCGACNVGWIDLSNATTGNVADLYVYMSLGPDPNDEPTRATAVSGPFNAGAVKKELHLQTVPAGGSVGTGDYPLRLSHSDVYVDDPNATNAGSIHVEVIYDDNVAIAGLLTGLLYFHTCH